MIKYYLWIDVICHLIEMHEFKKNYIEKFFIDT